MIRAVAFDSDGTLLDSFTAIVGAYEYVASTFGYKVPTAEMVREQLRHAPPIYEILKTFFPGHDIEELLQANNEYVINHFNEMVSGFEYLEESLQTLQDCGLKLAVVTGGNDKIIGLLEHKRVAKHFTSIVHCDRVAKSKPDPEGFMLAAKECGVLPHETIMVGDSPTDILAGKNGGAGVTIGIIHGHASREDLVAADTDYIVSSLKELTDLITNRLLKG